MEIKQKCTNSLPLTLLTFKVGESAKFDYNDFALNDAQSYRSSIFRLRKLGYIPKSMSFRAMDMEIDGKKAVLLTRKR